jgi:hypothetical protein
MAQVRATSAGAAPAAPLTTTVVCGALEDAVGGSLPAAERAAGGAGWGEAGDEAARPVLDEHAEQASRIAAVQIAASGCA